MAPAVRGRVVGRAPVLDRRANREAAIADRRVVRGRRRRPYRSGPAPGRPAPGSSALSLAAGRRSSITADGGP